MTPIDEPFTIQVSPAVDGQSGVATNGYQPCSSYNTTAWGGSDLDIAASGSNSQVVTGTDRPEPGKRRAYQMRAIDNVGGRAVIPTAPLPISGRRA